MYSAATVNRFKPAGRPRQFLLQLVSNLTSILTVFLINLIKNKDYGKSQIFCYVLRNFLFFPVLSQFNANPSKRVIGRLQNMSSNN